jgi:hypothetical protein
MRLAAAVLLGGLATACELPDPPKVFMCDEDIKCADSILRPGRCIYDGSTGWYCAIAVLGCPTGLRWTSTAQESLREKCVTQAILDLQPRLDGGTDDAPPIP